MINTKIFLHYYVNNWFKALSSGLADFFTTEVFDRVGKQGDVVLSTYNAAIQRIKQNANNDKIIKYPFIIFTPNTDVEPDPIMGRLLANYPRYFNGAIESPLAPIIYEDNFVKVILVYNRYVGSFDVNILCSSFDEMIDFKIAAIQLFGGSMRYSKPTTVDGILVLPDELRYYEYVNPYYSNYHPNQELTYQLDWDSNYAKSNELVIKNINQEKRVFVFPLNPLIRLKNVAEDYGKFGNEGDAVHEYRLQLSFDWEASVPCHLVALDIKTPIGMKTYPNYIPTYTVDLDLNFNYRLPVPDIDNNSIIYILAAREIVFEQLVQTDSSTVNTENIIYECYDKFLYTLSEQDIESFNNQKNVDIPISIENININSHDYKLRLYGKYGLLTPEFHWFIKDDTTISLVGMNMIKLKPGDVVWIVVYKTEDVNKYTFY